MDACEYTPANWSTISLNYTFMLVRNSFNPSCTSMFHTILIIIIINFYRFVHISRDVIILTEITNDFSLKQRFVLVLSESPTQHLNRAVPSRSQLMCVW